ncbi:MULTISPECIES: PepSY domain-containing protein [Methylobacterium]|uniref:PepSY domain-containing protein n=1 Tax=Methylobacterium jeotgali TaxID=381630 RepID=A0ABQ4STW0_9HYPH|nr:MULTISPECIES: PepSY domain-containing protein [Methylobacterium]PIU07925.1 MAG: hypothetical protein COT56_03240 [Methylobacterium sp. CG09_land_8_20_14_0_10_71_15]PIU13735.1 MAG: hypothetical protein COT28_10030 [Methylobacterium sp. CG08_land_8_20_14_0_20_71_15]GBU17069.1 hypothetical protein AwMethylo_12840 [Methylobacterium sp.]GJE06660.1 hypothetical protein AOPFMNJM_1982 [Methylobacterium jeotgali]
MRKTILAAVLAAAGAAAAMPAAAQGISIGPGGVRVDPGYRGDRGDADLTRGDAVRIARREGLVDVDNVGRRGPRFVVEGSDRRGNDITVVVDSRSGEVIDVRR